MTNTQTLIVQAYAAFNRRDIDGVLALMSVLPLCFLNLNCHDSIVYPQLS